MATTTFAERMQKRADWFLHTFSGRDAQQRKDDVPGLMARWMFRIGLVWACILLPVTAIFTVISMAALIGSVAYPGSLKSTDQSWAIAPFLLSGYAIWIGWGWRSRKVRRLATCVSFWAVSAAFNSLIPVQAWRNAHAIWVMFMPNVLWSILVAAASLVAIFLEFRLPRHGDNL